MHSGKVGGGGELKTCPGMELNMSKNWWYEDNMNENGLKVGLYILLFLCCFINWFLDPVYGEGSYKMSLYVRASVCV